MTERQAVLLELSRLNRNLRVLEYKPSASFELPPQTFDSEEFSLNDFSIVLKHGNKKLKLTFYDLPDSEFIHAGTKLEKVEGAQKMPKDTTLVYGQAFWVMQAVANYFQRPVIYLFYTKNEGLVKWSQDLERGASVFDWDAKVNDDYYYALKIIYPVNPT